MAVIIWDIDVPDRCEHCEFCRWSNLYQTGWCERLDATVPEYKTERDKNCPMQPYVPPNKQEFKTGHWIFETQRYDAWSHTCSECGKRMTTAVGTYGNYCWNCGTKMIGGEME